MIGIVSPTYDWGLPSIVREFLEMATFQTDYLYFVATYAPENARYKRLKCGTNV